MTAGPATKADPHHELSSGRRAQWSCAWHQALAVMIACAFLVQVVLVLTGGADANSGESGTQVGVWTRLVRLLSYFTIQSNLLVMASSAFVALAPARDGIVLRVLRLDAVLGIAVTGLVFATVLASKVHLTGWALACTIAFHYIAPPAAVLGWLVFGPRNRLDPATLAWSLVWPLAWIAYTLAHGAVTDWYPYPFLDVNLKGYPVALRNVALVAVVTLLFIALLWWLDRVLPQASRPVRTGHDDPRPR
ncbi:Pr6Pr family membrane protein [Streptomyces sp. H39-S7]|uniref:Pr6Pr family membrane protein n=1 Tax=Streptomyces sp. H39-S7 TaxID=3004357 RepID=UPI0022B06BDF|nr:Pr6Pr family membrane protein [Streptomyces sp. H39-S7]MCZ4126067.1 Pr6Pr family membrane protein [Streptomyces sp. H39-S7]